MIFSLHLMGNDLTLDAAGGMIHSVVKSLNVRISPEQSPSRRIRALELLLYALLRMKHHSFVLEKKRLRFATRLYVEDIFAVLALYRSGPLDSALFRSSVRNHETEHIEYDHPFASTYFGRHI